MQETLGWAMGNGDPANECVASTRCTHTLLIANGARAAFECRFRYMSGLTNLPAVQANMLRWSAMEAQGVFMLLMSSRLQNIADGIEGEGETTVQMEEDASTTATSSSSSSSAAATQVQVAAGDTAMTL